MSALPHSCLWIDGRQAREPFVLIVGQLAYNRDGPELAYRFERFSNNQTGTSGNYCGAFPTEVNSVLSLFGNTNET
jgi:hypothetical protein